MCGRFMAKRIALCALAGAIVIGTVLLVQAGFGAFSVGELLRGDHVTVFAAGGFFLLVFVAVGAGAMVIYLISAARRR